MTFIKSLALVLFIYSFSVISYGSETCTPSTPDGVLKCIQNNHPELVKSIAISQIENELSAQASASKNPTLSLEAALGKNMGNKQQQLEIRFSQAIQTNSLKAAKKMLMLSDVNDLKTNNLKKLEEVTLDSVKNIIRFSQINFEMEKINEALIKFTSISKLYSNRPKLNPENEATLGMIQIAINNYQIKIQQLLKEKQEISSNIKLAGNLSEKDIDNLNSKIKLSWPKINANNLDLQSSNMQTKRDLISLSMAKLDYSKESLWEELSVDLILQKNTDGQNDEKLYGLGVKIPLTVFNRNQREISLNSLQLQKAKDLYDFEKNKNELELQNLISQYHNSIQILSQLISDNQIEKRHQKIESNFSLGLISGPVLVEVHRQDLEYLETKHSEELRALEMLWKIYIHNGTFLNQKI